ncbi:S8 family serine peptidase [Primorskyibacter sp. 2E107]|uniref:S8 family serine peptidase n=1 Tax=Primorskyibacter sp. 2E107 TaxID=3403458 RepID=UPI003AF95963
MTRYIVLRDTSGNWCRSTVPVVRTIRPNDPDQPGVPYLSIWELTPSEVDEIAKDPSYLRVTPVMPTRLLAPEPMDDVRSSDLVPGWGSVAVGADSTPYSGKGVRVALLDTGIDARHPCFKGLSLTTRDFVGTGIDDVNGHGTHLAGTILGRDLGGMRIGVARGMTTLVAAKTLTDTGQGRTDEFLHALLWALTEKADIIGFSLAFDTPAYEEQLAAEGYPQTLAKNAAIHAYRGNLRVFETILSMMDRETRPLILGAVGNDSLRTISPDFVTGPASPAAARGVLTVGAIGPSSTGYVQAPFSNIGPLLVAPGVGIVSACPGGDVRSMNGSSMAMAHGVGVAALWAEHLRETGAPLNAETLAAALIGATTYDGISPDVGLYDRGQGLIQAPLARND